MVALRTAAKELLARIEKYGLVDETYSAPSPVAASLNKLEEALKFAEGEDK
jgi:hypothetical protein